jgi:hypothetical protein
MTYFWLQLVFLFLALNKHIGYVLKWAFVKGVDEGVDNGWIANYNKSS